MVPNFNSLYQFWLLLQIYLCKNVICIPKVSKYWETSLFWFNWITEEPSCLLLLNILWGIFTVARRWVHTALLRNRAAATINTTALPLSGKWQHYIEANNIRAYTSNHTAWQKSELGRGTCSNKQKEASDFYFKFQKLSRFLT